ncbi:MAG: copper resistance protein B [Sphingomonadales bacterium]|nr:copper resistance protein B [Sphingomonadales bacterium]
MDHAMHHPAMPQPSPDAKAPQPAPGGMQAMPGMDMPPSDASGNEATGSEPTGTDQPPGSDEAPSPAHDRLADRYWNPAEMAAAEKISMQPPLTTYARLTFDLAEYQFRAGKDGYRWESEAWLGDLNRFVLKSKGEGTFGAGLDHAEFQALYAKALDPWWNLQLGIRQDIRPRPARSWATIGIEGRAPYQFDVQAAVFLSDKGQFTGRLESFYDQRITQRLILQPRVEFDLAAQDMPDQRIGAGLSSAELGLRLRYEIRREFAPYIGVNWTWAAGRTATYARADGKNASEGNLVAGVRLWF